MTVEKQTEFLERQDAHFSEADVSQFEWQTSLPGVSEREHHFVRRLAANLPGPLIELGSGEGANLFHLAGIPAGVPVGVERSLNKARFAARSAPGSRILCGDATALPLASSSVGSVLIRDVLHHLPDPRAAISEAVRILQPGGRLVLAEPNARNLLIRLQMLLVPAERGAQRSTPEALRDLLSAFPLADIESSMEAPLPLDRVAFHPRFGLPSLGRFPWFVRLLSEIEAVVGRMTDETRFSYIILSATRDIDPLP